MLVITRRLFESIKLTGGIEITVVDIRKGQIKLAILAPPEIGVVRSELGTDPFPLAPHTYHAVPE